MAPREDDKVELPPIVHDIEALLQGRPDAAALRDVRALVFTDVFRKALAEFFGPNNNNFLDKEAMRERLRAAQLTCGEKSSERKNQLTNVRIGIAAGSAWAGAAIIATPVLGPFGPAISLVGAGIAGYCVQATSKLAAEEQIYADISARLNKLLEKLDAE